MLRHIGKVEIQGFWELKRKKQVLGQQYYQVMGSEGEFFIVVRALSPHFRMHRYSLKLM